MCKKYEAIFIIKNCDDADKVREVIDRINNMVISEYCDIFHKEELGVRKLAYEVKGEKKGYYYLINFKAPDSLEDTGKISIKINTVEEVIKHIIVKMEDD